MSDQLPAVAGDDLNALERAAGIFERLGPSGLLPKHIKGPADAAVLIAYGHGLGRSATWALRNMHVIEGKPTLSADAMLALALAHPDCEYIRPVEVSRERAVYEAKRRSWPEPYRETFDEEDARAAGLLEKSTWKKHRKAMLRARCAAAICRAVFADAIAGVYEHGELDADSTPRSPARATRGATPSRGAERARESAPDASADIVDAEFTVAERRPCDRCNGVGLVYPSGDRCSTCRGLGAYEREAPPVPAPTQRRSSGTITAAEFAARCRAVQVEPEWIDEFRQYCTGGDAISLGVEGGEHDQGWSRQGLAGHVERCEALRRALAMAADASGDQGYAADVAVMVLHDEMAEHHPTNSITSQLDVKGGAEPGDAMWKAIKGAIKVLTPDEAG